MKSQQIANLLSGRKAGWENMFDTLAPILELEEDQIN